MRTLISFLIVSIAILSQACTEGPVFANGLPPSHPTLVLRTDGLDEMQTNILLHGCGVWGEKVECVLEEEAGGARPDVTVVVDDGPCVPNKEGKVRIGLSDSKKRRITIFPACISAGQSVVFVPPERVLMGVATHELGHMMGIWKHVPASCADDHGETLGGDPLCGRAIMNPRIDPTLVGRVTDLDREAFAIRDVTLSIVDRAHAREKSAGDAPDDCTLWL